MRSEVNYPRTSEGVIVRSRLPEREEMTMSFKWSIENFSLSQTMSGLPSGKAAIDKRLRVTPRRYVKLFERLNKDKVTSDG